MLIWSLGPLWSGWNLSPTDLRQTGREQRCEGLLLLSARATEFSYPSLRTSLLSQRVRRMRFSGMACENLGSGAAQTDPSRSSPRHPSRAPPRGTRTKRPPPDRQRSATAALSSPCPLPCSLPSHHRRCRQPRPPHAAAPRTGPARSWSPSTPATSPPRRLCPSAPPSRQSALSATPPSVSVSAGSRRGGG